MGNAPPFPRHSRYQGASNTAPATAIPIAVRNANADALPIDVWRLIFAHLRPHTLAAAARVSTLWRHRVFKYLATARDLPPLGAAHHRLAPLDVGLATDETQHFTAVMGFAPHTGNLWCLGGSTAPDAPHSIFELDRTLRPVRTMPVPLATPLQPNRFILCQGGAVSLDMQEALLLQRSFTLRYPYSVYVYYLVTMSLTTLELSAPHEALTVRYAELEAPYVEARYTLLFTSQFALLAQVQGDVDFLLVFPRSATDGAYLKRHQVEQYNMPLSAGTVTADSFLVITGDAEARPNAVRVWRVSGDSVTQVCTVDIQAPPSVTLSCNAVVQGPFLHVYFNKQQAALHWNGGMIAIQSPWATLEPNRDYAFVHVRDDGLVVVEARNANVTGEMTEFRLLCANW